MNTSTTSFTAPDRPLCSYSISGEGGAEVHFKQDAASLPGEPRPDADERAVQSQQARVRQAAAAFLRAARLTQDEAERESLKRKAAELLSPRPRLEPKPKAGITRRDSARQESAAPRPGSSIVR